MKNFPHQFNDLTKLTAALDVTSIMSGTAGGFQDDGAFGEALAKAGVYSFRNKALSVAKNLVEEKKKTTSNQGFRTAARDIRRFFLLSGLVNPNFTISRLGRDIIDASSKIPLRNALWREAMLNLSIEDTEGNRSHPYRILLQLVADRPGIETTKLLLALEAENDSPTEYARIIGLASLPLPEIIIDLGIGESNARNAVKILPSIAEQVGDIKRVGKTTRLASYASSTEDSLLQPDNRELEKSQPSIPVRVDPDEISALPNFTATSTKLIDVTAAIEILKRRTIEHHKAVVSIAKELGKAGYKTYENPFDCLGFKSSKGGLLIEMKTLDGTKADERRQSEKALGQLRGYKHYNVPDKFKAPKLVEIVAYSAEPSGQTVDFLTTNSICSAWPNNGQWVAADLTGTISDFSPDDILED